MFNPSFDVEIKKIDSDKYGRTVILQTEFDNNNFVFVNIYAPNIPAEQQLFFRDLKDKIRPYANENVFLGGDFNCPLSSLDKKGGWPVEEKNAVIKDIMNLCSLLNLVDIWRRSHPNETKFTWHNPSFKIQCRLDLWFVSKHFLCKTNEACIIPVSFTDHSAIF